MKDKKTINITTSLFKLTVFWNGMYVYAQVAILIGLLLVRLFARQDTVKSFCLVAFLGDLLVVAYILFKDAKVSIEDGHIDTADKEQLDITVEHTKSMKNKGVAPKKEAVIHNKVGTPNPTPVTPAPEPVPAVEPVAQKPDVHESTIKNLDDLSAEDWENLFSGDDF